MIPLCQTLTLLPAPISDGAPSCLVIDVDLAGGVQQNWPEDGVSSLLTLPRSRVELGVTSQQYRGRIAVIGARSGGLTSSTGINGEAIVPELQIAEAAWLGPQLIVAAGLIDEPWVVTGNNDWRLRAAAPIFSESVGWMERSDLGLSGAWSAASEVVTVIATVTTGEGARFAERNNGKNTTGMLIVRPVPAQPERLTISLLGRDGSRGLDSGRDHRAGARITTELEPLRLGAEVLQAWGIDSDIDRTPLGLSAWTEAGLPWSMTAFARLDHSIEDTDNDSSSSTIHGGLTRSTGPMTIILGAEHTQRGDRAVAVAGAGALSSQTTAHVILAVRQGGAVALSEP